MMCGLLQPSAGKIRVLGMRIPDQTEAVRLQVGYMTQRFSMYGDLTVEQNLLFIGKVMGVTGKKLKNRVHELNTQFNLSSFSKNLAGSLSGGQKRRLAFAAATIHNPHLLLLDEPTSEVDPNTRREFWDQLFGMCEAGSTVLVTTHLMDEAERCHSLAIINEGRKVADGSPGALKKELGAAIIEVSGPDLSTMKSCLGPLKPVISTTRVGVVLRVMLEPDLLEPLGWVQRKLRSFDGVEIRQSQPSIEDVFVMATRNMAGK
jgi:ABC-2 type transport system ATP-binding protein